jgi:hypothetical protein
MRPAREHVRSGVAGHPLAHRPEQPLDASTPSSQAPPPSPRADRQASSAPGQTQLAAPPATGEVDRQSDSQTTPHSAARATRRHHEAANRSTHRRQPAPSRTATRTRSDAAESLQRLRQAALGEPSWTPAGLRRLFPATVRRGMRALAIAGASTSAVTATTHSTTPAAMNTNGMFSTPGVFQLPTCEAPMRRTRSRYALVG